MKKNKNKNGKNNKSSKVQYCILSDIDGTLFDTRDRLRVAINEGGGEGTPCFWRVLFEPSLLKLDKPIKGAASQLNKIKKLGIKVIYKTGRSEALREPTIARLHKYGFPTSNILYFRKVGETNMQFLDDVLTDIEKINNFVILCAIDDLYLHSRKIYEKHHIPVLHVSNYKFPKIIQKINTFLKKAKKTQNLSKTNNVNA